MLICVCVCDESRLPGGGAAGPAEAQAEGSREEGSVPGLPAGRASEACQAAQRRAGVSGHQDLPSGELLQ